MSSEPHPPRPRDPMRVNVECGGRDAEIAVSRFGGAAVVEARSPRRIRGGRRRPAVKGGPGDGWMMSDDIRAMAIDKGLVDSREIEFGKGGGGRVGGVMDG